MSLGREDGVEEDGLIDLPSFQPPPRYSEKASTLELLVGGQVLNLAGLALLLGGLVSFLRVTGHNAGQNAGQSDGQSASQAGLQAADPTGGPAAMASTWLLPPGLFPCLLGAAVGAFLTYQGERLFQAQRRLYALALLSAGVAVLMLTNAAAHATFGLYPVGLMLLLNLAVVGWAGRAALRHDSLPLAAWTLLGQFAVPMLSGLPLDRIGVVIVYLTTANLGTTLVAYRKKWDGLLIGALGGSYALFFAQFGLSRPLPTLGFLALTYTLFLASGNVFHFWRRTASDYHLGLSMVNPLLFACAAYPVLLKLPNLFSLGVFTAIAALHAELGWRAAQMKGQGQAYRPIVLANAALAVLFSAAAVSFLSFLSDDTGYFAGVAALWMAQALTLLPLSRRFAPDLARLTRRGSYLSLALASAQLVYVVPTMEAAWTVQLAALLALLGYFVRHETLAEGRREEQLFGNFVALVAGVVGYQLFPYQFPAPQALLGTSVLGWLMLAGYRRYPSTLFLGAYLSPALMTGLTVVVLFWPWQGAAWLLALTVVQAALVPLTVGRKELVQQQQVALTCSALLLVRTGLLVHVGAGSTLLWCLLGLALLKAGWERPALSVMFLGFLKSILFDANFTWGQAGFSLAVGAPEVGGLLLVAAVIGCYALAARWMREQPEVRNYYTLFGLLIFAFQTTFVLFRLYGVLDSFQVMLSGFWALASLLFIAYGIHREAKLFRLFGLAVLVSCVAKIYAVDIWVLDAFDKSTTTLVLGTLLMTTSFLYQSNRARLEQPCPA